VRRGSVGGRPADGVDGNTAAVRCADGVGEGVRDRGRAVRVLTPPTGSGYGGKHTGECAVEAARLAKAAGKPVKLQWTREDEFTWAYFGQRGWSTCGAARRRTARLRAGSSITTIRGARRSAAVQFEPGAEFHAADSPLTAGTYRGWRQVRITSRASPTWIVGACGGMEPAAFRMKNASDPRLRAVMEAATERFRWQGEERWRQRDTG